MAAADTLTDNYVHACAGAGIQPNFADIYRVLSEDVIFGYDVLPWLFT